MGKRQSVLAEMGHDQQENLFDGLQDPDRQTVGRRFFVESVEPS